MLSLRWDTDAMQGIDPTDMHVVRGAKPWLAEVWEPLTTKVPNPCIAQPYCCYINTVIFYLRPYVVRPWHHLYRWKDGWRAEKPGQHLEEWGRADTRLKVDQVVQIEGDDFEVGCGRVLWRGKGLGWWVRHPLRRRTTRETSGAA